LNSSLYCFLCLAIVRTPGAYWLRWASGKSGQLHNSSTSQWSCVVSNYLAPGTPCTSVQGGLCTSQHTCACPAPTKDCGNGVCVDVTSNSSECGTSCQACPSGASCVNASCVCNGGLSICDSQCVNEATDPAHCGGCEGHACVSKATCNGGACHCPNYLPDMCPTGCSNLSNGAGGSCGQCGIGCPNAHYKCMSGKCVTGEGSCDAGWRWCVSLGQCENIAVFSHTCPKG
jgi:hypothetical protein